MRALFSQKGRIMNKKEIFSGSGCALVTPFMNGEIDYFAVGELIDMHIAAGTDALIVGGTTGEAATLSDTERYRLYSYAKERVAGRTRLILGTGTNDTRVALSHARFAERLGCDGVLMVTPYYNKGTERGIEKHYLSVAETVDLPIIVYNVPSRTGVNLGIELLDRLADHENIVAIKEAQDSADRLAELAVLSDRLDLYAGNDSQIFTTMMLGGRGVISVAANVLPHLIRELCQKCLAGEVEEARGLQIRLLPFIKSLFLETNPSPIKYAMAIEGLCSPELRLPLSEPCEKTKVAVSARLHGIRETK